MPSDAPKVKLDAARLRAEVVLYDRLREDREAIARRLCDERCGSRAAVLTIRIARLDKQIGLEILRDCPEVEASSFPSVAVA